MLSLKPARNFEMVCKMMNDCLFYYRQNTITTDSISNSIHILSN